MINYNYLKIQAWPLFVLLSCFGNFAFAQASTLPVEDYKMKLVYDESRSFGFRTEDITLLDELELIALTQKQTNSRITQYQTREDMALVDVQNLENDDGVWPPDAQSQRFYASDFLKKDNSNTNGETSSASSRRGAGGSGSKSDLSNPLDFIQLNKFPKIGPTEIKLMKKNRIPFYVDNQGVYHINVSPNFTTSIDPIRKVMKDVRQITNQGSTKTVVKETTYEEIICPEYLGPNGTPFFGDINPLWFPIKIKITIDETSPNGVCIQNIIDVTREFISLDGQTSFSPL